MRSQREMSGNCLPALRRLVMARPLKVGVDYFSHDVHASASKTLFLLESRYGNDGYAFWFKLLETLGSQLELYYDCSNIENWLYLVSKTRVDESKATEIINLLAQIKAIDSVLWQENKIIWIQNFVDRLEDVFKKRGSITPSPDKFLEGFCHRNYKKEEFPSQKLQENGVSVPESTQSKLKESKLNKSKVKESISTPASPQKNLYLEHVTLTDEQYTNLLTKFGDENTVDKAIDILNNYKASSGRKYKSDYHTILGWVTKRIEEDQLKYLATKQKKDGKSEILAIARGEFND